jgi:hypothetical protein
MNYSNPLVSLTGAMATELAIIGVVVLMRPRPATTDDEAV